ncbi:hypothetical protein IHE44_0011815 [Lamprotornis superbus]|uniref:G-protein coupled receptors family 1 profile domain-containing protein n=1 Tax=Lamprotornis superbus TaxID=245042 RepID=A0A835NCU9_9PASS|nr:hypothetical protein IHE44_0011815 [Lamprotornis superbus]
MISPPCDTVGAHGTKETIVTVRSLTETRLHCDTEGNYGIKETIVTQEEKPFCASESHQFLPPEITNLMSCGSHCSGDPHAKTQQMSNSSSISHFLLLPLADTRQLQLLHFCLFLAISLAALLANGLIISAVACGHHLHTPMFFFLLNLALSDLGCICTTVPKAMHNSLWDTSNIFYEGCAAQIFFFLFFISAEVSLLTILCYDRYVSICKPLHYGTLLGSRACAHMAAAAWANVVAQSQGCLAATPKLP